MGIGVSLFLLALGAILAWAVDYQVTGVDINVVGAILMIVGALGLLLSLLFWSSIGGWPYYGSRTHEIDRTYVHDRDLPVDRTTVVHHDR